MSLIERFIFFPERELGRLPSDVGLPYEDVGFPAADGVRLHGWWIPGTRRETVIWFHGNAGNIGDRVGDLGLLQESVGTNVLLFDYRGYGRSDGRPSESGLYADARGALAYVRSREDVERSRIVFFGRSLGSAVAVELATRRSPWGLILESPFTSVRDMARAVLPGPLASLVPAQFDTLDRIGRVRCPTLFLHGDRDEVVPYEQGLRLHAGAPAPKTFHAVVGAGHNDTFVVGGRSYFACWRAFLDGLESG
jgi:fermentation-respiration switch protein FrsA (DUF1100 family)